MIFIILVLLIVIIRAYLGRKNNLERNIYFGGYDFDDEPGRNYNSYYAQIADDAMMGDGSAMEEMRREFGEDDR